MLSRILLISSVVFISLTSVEASKNFLANDSPFHRSALDRLSNKAFEDDIINALGPMLGCGGQATEVKMAAVRKTLEPMWRTLPKISSSDRIDRRSLRYLAHRYFMQTSSLVVVPAYVESVLESNHVKNYGFSLKDAVNMVVMLDQLIFDSESALLQRIYSDVQKPIHKVLSHEELTQILEIYMVEWMVEVEPAEMKMLLSNRTLLKEVIPHFEALVSLAEGRAKALHFARTLQIPRGHASNTWNKKYSFEDAHSIVGFITQNFQTFWQSECESMKGALVAMDTHHTGRVPLSKFYNTAINTDWRFGESESYLRELGALDESSTHLGAQVVIPNYIQATSNCIVSTPHYLVCCQNDCEVILGEIEANIQAPTAKPQDILDVVGNMTVQSSIDEEASPDLKGKLADLVQEIASSSGGVVPLHGRLFAQWLHFAFPRECSYPHKIGMVSAVTPMQYGDDYIADQKEMKKHAANATSASLPVHVNKDELHWMSQWSSEEELHVDYSSELGVSWQTRTLLIICGLLLLAVGLSGGIVTFSKKSSAVQGKKCFV